MSIWLQIAIPLFVTFAALAAIAIWRRFFRKEVFALALAVLGVGVAMTVLHTNADRSSTSGSDKLTDTDSISLMLAERYMLEDRYDEALDILTDLSCADGDNEQIRAALARCNLLSGNYTVAAQLFRELGKDYDEELGYAQSLNASTMPTDNSFITHLKSLGYDPDDYGLAKTKVKEEDPDAIRESIHDLVKDHLDVLAARYDESVFKAVKAAAAVTGQFAGVLEGTGDGQDWESSLSDLEDYMDEQSILRKNPYLRMARLKGNVLTGEYDKIAESADENVSAEELIVLVELYVKGLIKDSDLPENFMNLDPGLCETVVEKCRAALEKIEKTITPEQHSRYEAQLDTMEQQLEDPELFALRHNLQWQASSGDPGLSSKSYMALAKLEDHCENKEKYESYLSDAIGSAADSSDENYRIPMTQVAGIVNGTADSEEVKNVAAYVDQALNNALPGSIKAEQIPQQQEEATTEETGSFADNVADTVNQSTAMLNIGMIDKSDFSTVKARVQIQSSQWDSIQELEDHLVVYDCGSRITEFTLEKLEFDRSCIILLCDVSGSMSGSITSLQNAVTSFADEMQAGEYVCVMGFDDRIVFTVPFSDDPDEVAAAAEKIQAGGGTALYNSLLEAGALHESDINANNIIIAMTDGQDGNNPSDSQMYNDLGTMVADKGITVYTIGLGSSVDTAYLEKIAEFGNGSFLYVDDQESLENFYSFIHGQLQHQYILTYTARNKTLNERKLELSVEGELGGAEKIYYLVDKEYSDEDSDAYNPYTVEDTELTVNGLTTKFLYQSSQDQTVTLKGAGFDSGDDISIRISGNVKYDLKATYKDGSTYEILIPDAVSVGTYDLTVSVRGESVTLESELTIAVQGSERNFRFGAYNFTALSSYINDNGQTVLSGNVVMNGWLRFKGDVLVSNYRDTEKVQITDNHGFYIGYSSSTATGLAQTMAVKGISLSFNKLGSFYLYSDPYTAGEYDQFTVDLLDVSGNTNLLFFMIENPSFSIYPDMLRFKHFNMQSLNLPLQKQLLRNFSNDISGDMEVESLISATRIGMIGKVEYDIDKEYDFSMVSFPLRMNKLSVTLDTLKGDFDLDAEVKFKSIGTMEGMGFGFAVKDSKFDGLSLQALGPEVRLMDAPVPISIGDFGVEIAGFSSENSDDSTLLKVLDTDVSAEFKVKVASLNAYLPGIAKFIDDEKDVALAALDNCKLTANLRQFRLTFDADVVLATVLDMGKCHISLGRFDYTNALIGYYNETQYGLQAALTIGPKIETTNLTAKLQGMAELTLGYPYSGIWLNGVADFDVKWWILKADADVSGDILFGAYQNSSDNLQFSFIVRGTNNSGSYSGFHLYVTRTTGFDIYSY